MCGRYSLDSVEGLKKRFNLSSDYSGVYVHYNIAPGTMNPVVVRNSPNKLLLMKWGLIPFWSKDPKVGYKTINARIEDILEKPAFRKPIREGRCLVPATGFFEWKELNLEGKAEKIPFYISMKDKRVFSFAGVYDVWKDAEGKEFYSYAILTTTPNDVMSTIHNRMPIILNSEDEDKYLDKETDLGEIMKLLTPYKGKDLIAYPVARLVNSPSNDEKDILEELK